VSPSRPSSSAGQLSGAELARAQKVLRDLRVKVDKLIDREIRANVAYSDQTARKSSRVPSEPELFDEDGNLIFG